MSIDRLDIEYMQLALQLASEGRYSVSPNPMVGCVIVNESLIVGKGFHQYAGEAHAEILALAQADSAAKNATAYVTLEPCCHTGKTPPCTLALIAAGIKRVVIATEDPNPLVKGKGLTALHEAGIEVEIGVLSNEAKTLNEIFFHYMQYQRPFVIAKWAMSLDGKTITHPSDSRQISSVEAQFSSHLLRQQVDAILIGANTARIDNPRLDVRCTLPVRTSHPLRIILTTQGNLPFDLNVFSNQLPGGTLIVTTELVNQDWLINLEKMGNEVLVLPTINNHRIDLLTLLETLGRRGITSLLVEGGMATHHQFIEANLVNKFHVILSPVIIGSGTTKVSIANLKIDTLGHDYLATADITTQHNTQQLTGALNHVKCD